MGIILPNKRWQIKPPVSSQIIWGHPLSRGLGACYLLNEGGGGSTAGGTAFNLVGRLHGTIKGGIDVGNTRTGKGFTFNGSTGRVETLNFVLPPGGSGVTMATSVFSSNFTQNGMLIEKATVNAAYEIFCDGSGFVFLRGASTTGVSSAVPSNNVWHTIVGTIDASGNAVLYFDGVALSSGSVTAPADASAALYLGCFDDANYFFNGSMDWAMVWNRPLTYLEVQMLSIDPYCFIAPPVSIARYASVAGAAVTSRRILKAQIILPPNHQDRNIYE